MTEVEKKLFHYRSLEGIFYSEDSFTKSFSFCGLKDFLKYISSFEEVEGLLIMDYEDLKIRSYSFDTKNKSWTIILSYDPMTFYFEGVKKK